jgi:hypothetical protein
MEPLFCGCGRIAVGASCTGVLVGTISDFVCGTRKLNTLELPGA